MIQPFLIFTALLIIAAVVVAGELLAPQVSPRTHTSEDVSTVSTTVPGT